MNPLYTPRELQHQLRDSGAKTIFIVANFADAEFEEARNCAFKSIQATPNAPIRRALESLPLEGWSIRSRRIVRSALTLRKVDVRVRGQEHGRGWKALGRIVRGGALEPRVRRRSLALERERHAPGDAPCRGVERHVEIVRWQTGSGCGPGRERGQKGERERPDPHCRLESETHMS